MNLVAKEHLHAMGAQQFAPANPHNDDDDDVFPLWTYDPPSTVKKRLAGNVLLMQLC
jgi:hypothetical protein